MTGRLPLAIHPLRLRFTTDQPPPRHYLGSAWRGAFGHALKTLVCIFKRGLCEGCPLAGSCTYVALFAPALTGAPRGTPSPYTLYPAFEEGELVLYLTLLGETAAGHFPYVLQALRMAGEAGVAHRSFDFARVERFDGEAWRPLDSRPVALADSPPPPPGALSVRLVTPLRFKHRGHLATPEGLTATLWLTALRRRLISLAAAWGDEAAMRELCAVDLEQVEWLDADFAWRELGRYSNRQRRPMKMGGVVGAFTLDQEQAARLWPLLRLGGWTHLGKLTTMGLGRYAMEVIGE